MAEHEKKQEEEESGESAPLWMVTFSDMASLLMAFFVMLTTFASFGPEETDMIQSVGRAALLPNYGAFARTPKTSVVKVSKDQSQAQSGSEKPTLEKQPGGGFKNKNLQDFRNRKVFLIASRLVFIANGSALSSQGRDFLNTLAMFVQEVPNRIIISESGDDNSNTALGVGRSMVALKYLVGKGVSADNCNIGAVGISPPENFQSERMLEIVLLDEGVAK
jgi:chemotaxis protein MotB